MHLCEPYSEFTHWPVPKGHIYKLEATAYALLALVRAKVSMSYHDAMLQRPYMLTPWKSREDRKSLPVMPLLQNIRETLNLLRTFMVVIT